MTTLNSSLKISDEIAVIVPETEFKVTYKDLSDITGHIQVMFRDQSSPIFQGEKRPTVAIAMANGLEYISVFLALTMDGYTAAPLNPAYKSSEFNFYLEDLNSKLIIVQKGTIRSKEGQEILKSAKQFECFLIEVGYEQKRERIEYEVFVPENNYHTPVYRSLKQAAQFVNTEDKFPGNASESDVALILHTSGTTSRPKAVPLSHLNITTSMKNISGTYKLTKEDSSYVVMPLFHVHGLIGVVLSTLFTQGTVVVPNRFSASWFWADYVVNKCTWFSFSPTIGRILLSNPLPEKVPYIRFIRSCSSPLDAATYHNLENKLKAPVLEAYAMTEAAHQMTSNGLPPELRKIGTVGKPRGVKVIILGADNQVLPQGQEGEVSISGLNVTSGYINNEKANRENFVQESGYFKTGDLGYFDEDGFLVLKGRRSEIINRGGEKISPAEVDEAMLSHPLVSEAVAFAVPDAKYGQIVNAAIVLQPGANLTFEELISFLKARVVGFKLPERVHFVTSLPKTATGKTQRKLVAKAFESKSKL